MYYTFLTLLGIAAGYAVTKVACSVAVFPGQLFAKPRDLRNYRSDYSEQVLTFSEEETSQRRILQSVKIEPANKTGNVIIIFNGQNATFRNEKKLRTYCQLAQDTGHTVIGFDYSGTATFRISTWSHHALVSDGLHLVLKVAKEMPENGVLILKGNSLGGAIATKVAKRCHDPDINIKAYLWNGRSFKSVSAAAAGHIRTLHRSGHYENSGTRLVSKVLQPIFSFILNCTQFEIDAAKDYKKIPVGYKNYYMVRSDAKNRLDKKDDVIIPYCAALEADKKIKKEIKTSIKNGDKAAPGDIAYYRARRKVVSKQDKNAHATPENELFCRNDSSLSAYKLFCQFSTEYVKPQETRASVHSLQASYELRTI